MNGKQYVEQPVLTTFASAAPAGAVRLRLSMGGILLLQGLAMLLLAWGIWIDAPDWLQLALVLLSGVPVLLWHYWLRGRAWPSPGAVVADALLQLEPVELARYHQLVQYANDIFSWHDPDGGLRHISPNVHRLLGYHVNELLGLQLFQYIHPDDLASVHLARADLLAERTLRPITFRILHRNGEWIWLEMFARLFDLGPGKSLIVGVSRDVTARLQAEADRRETERFKALFELARDGLLLVNQRGQIVDANREMMLELGYAHPYLAGLPLEDLLADQPCNSALLPWPELFAAIQAGLAYPQEVVLLSADGQCRWMEAAFSIIVQDGQPVALLALRDMTARRQAEAQLQQSLAALRVLHNRLYGIIEGSDDLIAAFDPDFRLIAFNRAFRQTFEQHLQQPVSLGLNLLIHLADDPQHMADALVSIQRALAGDMSVNIESMAIGDATIQYEVKYSPIRDEVGEVVGAAYVARDITLRLSVEHQLKAALARLEQARKESEQTNRQLTAANGELMRKASQDGMTVIANRSSFDEYLTQEWRLSVRRREPLALIFADVDHFKQFNDLYGHQAGDDCLRKVARALAKSLRRPADLLARYGGEEFVVLLPATTLAGAVFIAEAMCAAVQSLALPHAGSDVSPWVTLSLGVSSIVPNEVMAEGMLIYGADQALYLAKKSGRNRVHGNPL